VSTETTQELAAKPGLKVTETHPTRPRNSGKVPRYINVTETVDVDIDADTLHNHGWHHDNECPAGPVPLSDEPPLVDLRAAIEALHHQAHGRGSLALCREVPCSALSLDQLRGAA
jgi:hypothetical protein